MARAVGCVCYAGNLGQTGTMDKPPAPPPANPIDIAREALRRLALQRIAPTPDNYRKVYHDIAGGAPGTSAVTVLDDLRAGLAQQFPDLAGPLADFGGAVAQGNWALARQYAGTVLARLRDQAGVAAAGERRGVPEAIEALRDMLVTALDHAIVTLLAHDPTLAERARQLATEVRAANGDKSLRDAATALRRLCTDIELRTGSATDQQDMLKRILMLLVENIGELLDDDTWLRGQIDVVQQVLEKPLAPGELQEAERRLKEVIYKQSLVKHGLKEATTALKKTMATFVDRLGSAVAQTGDYRDKIAGYAEQISNTDDVLKLNEIIDNLLKETRSVQDSTRRTHDELLAERVSAEAAEARIRELETRLTQMSALVREDPLTKSLNRRGMDDEFAREAARADRHGSDFCIAVIDIDNFKKLNDQHGHQAGDEALVHLVKTAKESLRLTDHVARLGGEEFVLMLPNTPLDEAVRVVERLQRALTKKYFLANNDRILITFSAGVARREPGEAQDDLIARADEAMYEAKQTGKNRVCVARERRAADGPADATFFADQP